MTSMLRLVELSDRLIREELGDYYVITKSRADNMIHCFEKAAKDNRVLNAKINQLREVLEEVKRELSGDIRDDSPERQAGLLKRVDELLALTKVDNDD